MNEFRNDGQREQVMQDSMQQPKSATRTRLDTSSGNTMFLSVLAACDRLPRQAFIWDDPG